MIPNMKQTGQKIFLAFFVAGIIAMIIPNHAVAAGIGVACWMVAVFIGGSLWLAGHFSQKRGKSRGVPGVPTRP